MKAQEEVNVWLEREELLWRQRSKTLWLAEGDQNTKYFYSKPHNVVEKAPLPI